MTKVVVINYNIGSSKVRVYVFSSTGKKEYELTYDRVDKIMVSNNKELSVVISKWFRGEGISVTIHGIRGEVRTSTSSSGLVSISIR